MAIPLKYNLRNLVVRWRMTLATMLGIAFVVFAFMWVMALAQGLKSTYISTGDKRNLLVLRRGSTAESSSQIGRDDARRIKYLTGVERDQAGNPVASPEIVVLINIPRSDNTGSANVLVRGIGPVGLQLRPDIKIIDGRMFEKGLHECVVSTKISERFANCRVGQTFHSGRNDWHVVGIFDAHKTAYDSEIWVDADEARSAFKRDFYGSVLLRPIQDAATIAALTNRMNSDRTLQVRALPETDYYAEQTKMAGPIQFIGSFLTTILSIGAAFSAMNTMYAAVGSRTREIGTLRVLGFKRRDIYFSFMIESIVLGLCGGAVGCALSYCINGISTGMLSMSFSEVAFEFRITGNLIWRGMRFALIMGVVGGLLPARQAARKPVLDALRAV